MKLSKYVSLAEVIRSDTAKRKGIDNSPTAEHLENLKVISEEVFDKVREYFGVPLYISSAYRSDALTRRSREASLRIIATDVPLT
jgi:zinc D-Ala-D-Ala carboxypeptidase